MTPSRQSLTSPRPPPRVAPARHSPGRLDRQAVRTAHLRHPLYQRVGLAQARTVLDVGCGNGAVTRDLALLSRGHVTAVDVDPHMVAEAQANLRDLKNVKVQRADAERLPFDDGAFDLVACNLLLLWVRDPPRAVTEMARVCRPGGTVLASMEPDYGGKMHYPENPLVDQVFQGGMITRKGGDPHAGRKLRGWFVATGLQTEVGLSNPHVPSCEEDLESYELERPFYRRALLQSGLTEAQVNQWEREYQESLRAGVQFNFLPLLFGIGKKR